MAAAAPYALAIGGALLKNQATQQQAREQRSQLNTALARTDQTQQKANTMIGQEADKLSPIARMANMQTQVDTNAAGSKADLAASGATDPSGNAIIDTSGDHGAVSKEFLTAKADRAISEGTRLSAIAKQLAQVRAPDQLVSQEGQGRASLTEALANMWDSTNNLNGANQNTAQATQLPGYAAAGDLMSAAGSAYGGKGMGVKKPGVNRQGGTIWSGGDDTTGGFA